MTKLHQKLLAVLLLVILLVVFSACGNYTAQPNDVEADDDIAAHTELAAQEEPLPPIEPLPEPEPETAPEEPAEIDPEVLAEIVELLGELEHPGVNLNFSAPHFNPTGVEGAKLEIASFINGVNGFWGPPEESFLTPENAPFWFTFYPSYFRTPSLQWHSADDENYHPDLSMLAPYLEPAHLIYRNSITLRTQMEDTARALFGAMPDLSHEPFTGWMYSIELGGLYVYVLGTFGVGGASHPIVMNYEYIGDGFYEVSCVYLHTVSGVHLFTDGNEIPDDELIAYLHTLPRHTVVLQRNEAGGFYYRAHILPEDDLPTAREVRELLGRIPYSGLRERGGSINDWFEQPVATSETAAKLAEFISVFNHTLSHPPFVSFETPEDAPPEFVFWNAFNETNTVQWSSPDWAHSAYHPELQAIVPLLYPLHYQIRLHNHMEETTSLLFGQTLEITHRPLEGGFFNIYDLFGVKAYSQEGFGIPAALVPIILSYKNTGDGYEVRVVFVWLYNDEFHPVRGQKGQEVSVGYPMDELEDYLRTITDVDTITLRNNPQGGWFYHAHILPEGWGEGRDENG